MAQPPIFAPDNKGDILAFFQQYKVRVVADALPPTTSTFSTPLSIAPKGKSPANGAPIAWESFRTGKFWFTTLSWIALSGRRPPTI